MNSPTFDYAVLFDVLPIPAILVDAEGIIRDFNQASMDYAYKRYGRTIRREDRIGYYIWAFGVTEEDRVSLESFIREVLETEEAKYLLWKSKDKAGRTFYVDIHSQVLRDAVGRMIGTIFLGEDVTEKVWQERQRQAIAQVREVVWGMRGSDDMEQVLIAVRDGLRELGVPFRDCGVNLVDGTTDPPSVQFYSMTQEEQWTQAGQDNPGTKVVIRIWQGQTMAYRRNLEVEDVYGEAGWFTFRSVVDVPFSHGTLAVNSDRPNAFSEEDLTILQQMAQVLSEGFSRLENLRTLEQRNRELEEKERLLAAFDQIGQAVLSSLELECVVSVLTEQIIEVGIFRSLMVAIVDEQTQSVEVVQNLVRRSADGRDNRDPVPDGKVIGLCYSLDDNNITAEVARTGEMRVIVEWDDRFDRRVDRRPEDRKGQVAYFIPVTWGERVLAVLATGSRIDEKEETLNRIAVMGPLLKQVAIALEHARLYKALQESEEQYRTLAEAAHDMIFVIDRNMTVQYVNSFAAGKFNCRQEDLIGKHMEEIFPHDTAGRLKSSVQEVFETSESLFYERRIPFPGSEIWLGTRLVPIVNRTGEVTSVLGIARDVTRRKQAEVRIKASLREKEVLLKEIHHRVKNNLQIISSLLNLQASSIDDQHVLEVFKETQSRIKSIALIHEELYQSNDLGKIDIADYLRRLIAYIFRSYGGTSEAITLKIDVEDIPIDVNTVVLCGLIINELVSNALKYAFPKDRKGEIGIEMQTDRMGQVILVVRDSGVGFPEGIDFRKTDSLGLQLVNTLAAQLGGTVALHRNGGTEFTITFTKT